MKKPNNISIHKTIIWILLVVITIEFINIFFNDNSEEFKNIKIDKYNFKQLEKVKDILDWLDKNSYSFGNLNQFNEKYNQNIKTIKNCYFIADRNRFFESKNWWWGYIFWFKLESQKYLKKYWTEYYAYPKYDLPKNRIYLWMGGWWVDWEAMDSTKMDFEKKISNPCKD